MPAQLRQDLPGNGSADDFWELGTRDTGAYASFSEVVDYLDWLGGHFTDSADRRRRLLAAGTPMVLGLTAYGDADVTLARE